MVTTVGHSVSAERIEYDWPSRWYSDETIILPPSDQPRTIELVHRYLGAVCEELEVTTTARAESEIRALGVEVLLTEAARYWASSTTEAVAKTISALERALAASQSRENEVKILKELVFARRKAGDNEGALIAADAVLKGALSDTDKSMALWMKGLVGRDAGEFEQSANFLKRALDYLQPNSRLTALELEIQSARCDVLTLLHPEGTLECLELLLASPAITVSHLSAHVLNNLGGYYAETADFGEAIELFERSAAAGREAGSPRLTALALNNAAHALRNAGLFDEARSAVEESLALLDGTTGKDVEAHAYQILGGISLRIRDFGAAKRYFQLAKDMASSLRIAETMAWSMQGLGESSRRLGQVDSALAYNLHALDLVKQIFRSNPRAISSVLESVGHDMLELGRYSEGLEYVRQGEVLPDSPELSRARLKLLRSKLEAALGRYRDAEESAQYALDVATRSGDQLMEADALRLLAKSVEVSDWPLAIEYGDSAMQVLEEVHSRFGTVTDAAYFADLVDDSAAEQISRLLGKGGENENEWVQRAFERDSRAREVVDHQSRSSGLFLTDSLRELRLQMVSLSRELRIALAAGDANSARIEASLELLNRQYETRHLARSETVRSESAAKPLSLPSGHAYVSYRDLGRKTVAFFLKAEGLSWFDLGKSARLEVLTDRVVGALRNGDRDMKSEQELSRLLFLPLARSAETFDHLHVSINGATNRVPFSVLSYQEDGYWRSAVEDFSIRYNPHLAAAIESLRHIAWVPESLTFVAPYATTTMLEQVAPPDGNGTVHRVGGNAGRLPALPWSAVELRGIRQNFGKRIDTLLGNRATFSALRSNRFSGSFDILHFSTHGYVSLDRPDLAGLFLARDGQMGGEELVGWRELQSIGTTARLVFLNGCETASGVSLDSTVLGPTRAFFNAGAREVVSTQWPVADRSSALLASAFYRHLAADDSDPARALQLAQLELRGDARFEHPFHWGSYRVYSR